MDKNIMLIVDDMRINRKLLEVCFSDKHSIINACYGRAADYNRNLKD